MQPVKLPTRLAEETVEEFVRRHYCVSDPDGLEDPARVKLAVAAVIAAEAAQQGTLPRLPGVPHVRFRIDKPSQIQDAVRLFLPEVEHDPRLHALSFVDPLVVANELGVVVSPLVARVVRRGLAGAVTFDRHSLDATGSLVGVGTIRWRPKAGPGAGR
jgi:hypothetical protein